MLESLLHAAATPRPGTDVDSLPPPRPGTALAAGASHLVEAATTEAALEQVNEQLGAHARIVDARRVRRGGLGGFFAKEVVQLHAATTPAPARSPRASDGGPSDAARHLSEDRRAPAGGPPRGSVSTASPVDRVLAQLDDAPDDVDFATYLRDQLGPDLTQAPAPVDEPVDEVAKDTGTAPTVLPVTDWSPPMVDLAPDPAPARGGGWSHDALLQLGLPAQLVRSLAPAASADDLAWTTALTEALRSLCRPLPSGPAVLVGPRAGALGATEPDVTIARSDTWLTALRRDRWVHLVVGGPGWRDGLAARPVAVSWTRDEDLPEAIRVADEMGLVLGYGPGTDSARRARPFDVALAVRAKVVRR